MCICNVSSDNSTAVEWARVVLGDCVYTPLDQTAVIFGLVSIILFAVALFPQLYESYKQKKVEGLSVLFVLNWLLGDGANLLGCILTQQLPTQLFTSVWYIGCDLTLLGQYSYYRWCYGAQRSLSDLEVVSEESALSSPQQKCSSASEKLLSNPSEQKTKSPAMFLSIVLVLGVRGLLAVKHTVVSSSGQGRVLLAVSTEKNCLDPIDMPQLTVTIGQILAWLSGILYICGRVPQLLTNRAKRSVEGLSMSLFVITVVGNILYGLSVILHGQVPWLMADPSKFWKSVFPYLLGSIGTLIFDVAILGQFFLYRKNKNSEQRTSDSDHLGLTVDYIPG